MKCDRRWWVDGAYDAAIASYLDHGRETVRLDELRDRLLWMADRIREHGTAYVKRYANFPGDDDLDIRVTVVVEGLDGTNRKGRAGTLLGVSSDEDSLRTEAILKSAAVASGRIEIAPDPRRKRGGR